MVAVLFAYPLYSPPSPDRGNKILWRSKAPLVPSDPLRIEARLNGTGTPTEITVRGGPGPSSVDLPSPGCWRLGPGVELPYGLHRPGVRQSMTGSPAIASKSTVRQSPTLAKMAPRVRTPNRRVTRAALMCAGMVPIW